MTITGNLNLTNISYNLPFNPKPSIKLHIDINSCFASIEQQANPLLRGKPIVVAAYTTPSGCILAASIEAKRYGIKTGMRVKDGKLIYPNLIVLPPDPWKYRTIHLRLRKLLEKYTDNLVPKSIDEFVLDLGQSPCFKQGMKNIAQEIKSQIKQDIGDWLTVSVGIAPNRFLAKVGAGLHKPDGLDEINQDTALEIFSKLNLMDICGIKKHNAARLNSAGIYTALDFYCAPVWKLKAAFHSVVSYDWYLRLRGWEIDDVTFARRSYGNSFVIPKPVKTIDEATPILQKLVEKMGQRLRAAGFKTRGVHLALSYKDGEFWHKGVGLSYPLFDSRDIYKQIFRLFLQAFQKKLLGSIAVSCFNLEPIGKLQLELFEDTVKKEKLVQAIDEINERWGNFVVTPAGMLQTNDVVYDRIAFGGVKELEEFSIKQK